MKRKKPTNGGARPNAGRKTLYPNKKTRSLKLSDTAIAIVDAKALALGPKVSRSDALEHLVRESKAGESPMVERAVQQQQAQS
jgi:hypothetical protein